MGKFDDYINSEEFQKYLEDNPTNHSFIVEPYKKNESIEGFIIKINPPLEKWERGTGDFKPISKIYCFSDYPFPTKEEADKIAKRFRMDIDVIDMCKCEGCHKSRSETAQKLHEIESRPYNPNKARWGKR